ncbi:MAG: xanthine dehydrogenase family protein subunit M, partial [Gammaproteobacteria bacterium]
SGAAPVPWRSQATEAVIRGKTLDEGLIRDAARAAVADATPMSKNAYKIPLFRGMVEEELRKAASA